MELNYQIIVLACFLPIYPRRCIYVRIIYTLNPSSVTATEACVTDLHRIDLHRINLAETWNLRSPRLH